MQFGKLTSYESMQRYFNEMRATSRTQLLNKIYKSSGHAKNEKIEDDLTNTFVIILQNNNFNYEEPITKQILEIFGIAKGELDFKTSKEKATYLQRKIFNEIEQLLPSQLQQNQNLEYELKDKYLSSSNQFEWVGVRSHFPNLRSVFQEILLEKVKLFDQDLTRISDFYQEQEKKYETLSTARTFRGFSQRCKTEEAQKVARDKSIKQLKRMQSNLQRKGFTNVLIRDHSQFTLNKWTRGEEKQFQKKMEEFKNNFNKNEQKSPIIFQFVKKYTQTVKARDNIFRKWENRSKSGITPEELRYLCSTSLFLNKTINKSQKERLRTNIRSLGRDLVSRLEVNIAEKIIETYKQFMKRVSDLRARYYEQLTQKRKQEHVVHTKKEDNLMKVNQKRREFLKFKEIFTNICKSQKMNIVLNPRVYRWVKLFIKNIKQRTQETRGKKFRQFHKKQIFNRLHDSKKITAMILKNKMRCPSTRIIQREEHKGYRINAKNFVPPTRFEYDASFERHIQQYNGVKVKNNKSYINQLTGGPKKQKKDVIIVDIVTKEIILSSNKCLKAIVMIQAKWRMIFARRRYQKKREQFREEMKIDFQERKKSLREIYPFSRKIDLKSLQDRLKRVSMRTLNVLKPYTRTVKKPINLYTSFCRIKLSLNELKLKNTKYTQIRIHQFIKLVEHNQFKKLQKSGFVLTAKEINQNNLSQGANAIWWAVKNSNYELVKIFLEGGGNPNSANQDGSTCLHQSIQNGALQIAFLLLDFGADLNIKNNKKVTALYYATPKMLKWLGLEQGSVSGDSMSLLDNNSLFFNPETVTNFYPDHYY